MEYSGYKAIDFLNDDDFLSWLKKSDTEAIKFWESFLKSHPEKQPVIDEAIEIFNLFKINEDKLSLDEVIITWENIKNPQKSKKGRFIPLFKYAAILILVFAAGAIFHALSLRTDDMKLQQHAEEYIVTNEPIVILSDGSSVVLDNKNSKIEYSSTGDQLIIDNDTLRQEAETASPGEEVKINSVIIPYGSKSQVTLCDGTKIWLNAGSRLIYPTQFSESNREVMLSGEAYFDVTRNEQKPFIVKTTHTTIEVLGTKFNVFAYPGEIISGTVLVEGSVAVEYKKEGLLKRSGRIILAPNQCAFVNTNKGEATLKEIDTYTYTSWIDGVFKFDFENLNRVLKKLERYYNIRISLEDPLIGLYKISGKLDLRNSPEEVLNIVKNTIPVDWEKQNNNQYLITSKR